MLTTVTGWLTIAMLCAVPVDKPTKPESQPGSYVEFDFAPLPRDGVGTYKLQFTILTADKDIKLSEPAVFGRKEGNPGANCEAMALFLNNNKFKAEVIDKTKLRVYGRIFNDKLIPATKGMVESPDLKPEELPKVKNAEKKG